MDEVEKAITKGADALIKQLARNMRFAAIAVFSGNILAARIISAKNEAERNAAIKEGREILDEMKETVKRWENE